MRRGLLIVLSVLMLVSCIREEAPNTEADIISCILPSEILLRAPIITNEKVVVYVKEGVDLKGLAPEFAVSDGASIAPRSGTKRDFSTPQPYTVTSEDHHWSKVYTVEIGPMPVFTEFHFEDISGVTPGEPAYDVFVESKNGFSLEWSSGNAGYYISNSNAKAKDYPTCQASGGVIGKCVKLETRSTGSLGQMFGAPIAAGNLFLGSFHLNLQDPLKSTHMGIPFFHKPKTLTGWYKYKAGTFSDGKKDTFDIYAVMFESTDEVQYLDGSNVLSSKNLVLVARLDGTERLETDEWTRFEIPFKVANGKTIDSDKLTKGGYNLSIVLSSSRDGASFNGAVGSTLYADELTLILDEE